MEYLLIELKELINLQFFRSYRPLEISYQYQDVICMYMCSTLILM